MGRDRGGGGVAMHVTLRASARARAERAPDLATVARKTRRVWWLAVGLNAAASALAASELYAIMSGRPASVVALCCGALAAALAWGLGARVDAICEALERELRRRAA